MCQLTNDICNVHWSDANARNVKTFSRLFYFLARRWTVFWLLQFDYSLATTGTIELMSSSQLSDKLTCFFFTVFNLSCFKSTMKTLSAIVFQVRCALLFFPHFSFLMFRTKARYYLLSVDWNFSFYLSVSRSLNLDFLLRPREKKNNPESFLWWSSNFNELLLSAKITFYTLRCTWWPNRSKLDDTTEINYGPLRKCYNNRAFVPGLFHKFTLGPLWLNDYFKLLFTLPGISFFFCFSPFFSLLFLSARVEIAHFYSEKNGAQCKLSYIKCERFMGLNSKSLFNWRTNENKHKRISLMNNGI